MVPLVPMRRIAILGLAASYGLSFVAVCLAACLMGSPAGHACCATESEQTVRAADSDCCSVTAGISCATVFVADAAPAVETVASSLDGPTTSSPVAPFATVAPSPPLILRI
jgi:hypothetical protein